MISKNVIKIDFTISGLLALEKVHERLSNYLTPYKLIFMDVDMPSMDGITACQKIIDSYLQYGK